MSERNKTSLVEWIGLILFVVVCVIVVYIIFWRLEPELFSGSDFVIDGRPTNIVTCPTSLAPVNLSAIVNDVSKPSFDASWDPVLTTVTPNQTILGYNVYVSTTTGITKTNTGIAGFTPTPGVRVTSTSNGSLDFSTIYYFRVSTVDSCGNGILSSEEFAIST
tara:strand:+ start:1784 stop:2272 length:489 start_codon:yes stop_codon:yes gene_type:complete